MSIYNLRTVPETSTYVITKFTPDLDVESSYVTSHTECECPAGRRPSCRHRQMLPVMLAQGIEDTSGFYDFDNDQFLEPEIEDQDQPADKLDVTGTSFTQQCPECNGTMIPGAGAVSSQYRCEECGRIEPASAASSNNPALEYDPMTDERLERVNEKNDLHGLRYSSGPAKLGDVHPTIGSIKRRI